MTKGESGSAQEIQWLIEDRKRRMEDIREQLGTVSDEEKRKGFNGMIAMLEAEISDLEDELNEMSQTEGEDDFIADLDSKLADIDIALKNESDPIVRNNLEVSKRFLQMERNHALIEKTQSTKKEDPLEERVRSLENSLQTSKKYAEELRVKLDKALKDAKHYRMVAENPDRNVKCDATRVSVEAGTLSDLRNQAKIKTLECENLKRENRALKDQIAMLHKNIGELTVHCKEGDTQILILQKRLTELRQKLDGD
jgi:chromosome segregation ATPase